VLRVLRVLRGNGNGLRVAARLVFAP
jgi:hypothetical protein